MYDQITLQELKSMFAEMKELLNQQVTHFVCFEFCWSNYLWKMAEKY